MIKKNFADKLKYFMQKSNIKSITLANELQYDLSYISKWLNGKLLPSEKNIDDVIRVSVNCILKGDPSKLLQEYDCTKENLKKIIQDELYMSYKQSRPKSEETIYRDMAPITEVVDSIDVKVNHADQVTAVVDIFSLPHENRLTLAGIKNGFFAFNRKNLQYRMAVNINFHDCVYDSIYLVHILTSFSGIDFCLYNHESASGKLIYCIDDSAISSFVFPGNKDCISVAEVVDGGNIYQNINSLFDQEKLIFRKSTMEGMIASRAYIQTLISTDVKWVLGHVTELLLPEDVFDELMAADDRDTSEYKRLYKLSQNLLNSETTKIMLYESAISSLVIDGIVDFYNRSFELSMDQVDRCIEYFRRIVDTKANFKFIDGGFSEDFRYITNPCVILSDSICYLRLENNRYSDNILGIKDKMVKALFNSFFDDVWVNRPDVVTEDREMLVNKLNKYQETVQALL